MSRRYWGRVEMWRGDGRLNISVCRLFRLERARLPPGSPALAGLLVAVRALTFSAPIVPPVS